MYQALHYELVAAAKVANYIRKYSSNKIGCMIAWSPIYPERPNPKDVLLAQKMMHTRTLCSDVSVRGHYPNYILKEWERKGLEIEISEQDLAEIQLGVVDFVGISY